MPDSNKKYDAVVIGAGHNGLVCANYLAREGRKVLVLEAGGKAGGLAAGYEFAEGFKTSVAQSLPQLTRELVRELQLEKHGFETVSQKLPTVALDPQGNHIRLFADRVEGAGTEDQQAYRDYVAMMTKFARTIAPFWHKTPPRIGSGNWMEYLTFAQFGWKLRSLGREDMGEFLRVIALPAQDLMDEFFSSPLLKAALSWDFNIGNKLAPRSPNNAVLNQLYRLSGDMAGEGVYNSAAITLPKGGMDSLINALVASAQSVGVDICCNSPVASVLMDNHQLSGVVLEDGEQIHSPVVVSNADPKTSFMKLLGGQHLEVQFAHRINRIRNHGMVAKLHLGLDRVPDFRGMDSPEGRLLIAPTMSYIESAYDSAKYGESPASPAMEILLPTFYDKDHNPELGQVLSANIQYVPYEVKGGWEVQKPQLMEGILQTLEVYAPDIRSNIVASELLTPADLESRFRVQGGHWHHAEFSIDQWWMNRPTYGASQYKTPVEGFYLCGAGAHPGGGIMGAAGANAAREVMSYEH